MSDAALRRVADATLGTCVVLVLATAAIATASVLGHDIGATGDTNAAEGVFSLVDVVVFAVAGTIIVHVQTRNAIGWVLLTVGVLLAVGLSFGVYAEYGIRVNPGSLPASALVNALGGCTWVPAVGLMAIYVPLLFPDGHLASPRWRWLAWLGASVILVLSLGIAMDPNAFDDSSLQGVANPLASDLPESVQQLAPAVFVLFALCMVAAAVAAVQRFRRSDGIERLKLKWLLTAGALAAACFGSMLLCLALIPTLRNNGVINALLPLTFTLFPLAIGAAILRYRLYDIDVVISKSLVFGFLAAFITSVYVAIVVGVGHLVGSGDRPNLALSVAATSLIAIAFEPVRDRLQRLANRLVYGERASPYEVLSAFAVRIGEAYDPTDLLPLMATTVGQGVEAQRAQVWLNREDGFQLAVEWAAKPAPGGRPSERVRCAFDAIEGDRVAPIRDGGELLGAVAVTNRPGKDLTPVADRLLETLATQAGPVLRNVRLLDDLRRSRQRLVATQDDERRGLERNLHDGAQQSLVALALMLRLAQPGVAARSSRAGATLDEAAAELGRAIEELRNIARGIYPAVLAERGLGPALGSLAERSAVPAEVVDQLRGRVSQDVERALYFIAADVLVTSPNAGASHVTVVLEKSASTLVMRIDDDGTPAGDPRRGLNVQSLLDRGGVVDADLRVAADPPGLHLICSVPDGADTWTDTPEVPLIVQPLGASQ